MNVHVTWTEFDAIANVCHTGAPRKALRDVIARFLSHADVDAVMGVWHARQRGKTDAQTEGCLFVPHTVLPERFLESRIERNFL